MIQHSTSDLFQRWRTVLHIVQSPVCAAYDALRAFMIAPIIFARSQFEELGGGGLRLISRNVLSGRQRLRVKIHAAWLVFRHGVRLRFARDVCISRLPTEGLLANLLHVVEVVHRVRPDARVCVNWVIDGSERGFRYGRIGENVWTRLCRPVDMKVRESCLVANYPQELAFWGTGRDYLQSRALVKHRRTYNRTLSRWIEVTNVRVLEEVGSIRSRFLKRQFCIGIHRRIGNSMVPDLQRDGVVPSIERFIECAREQIRLSGREDWVVFLATDDANAILPLREAFNERLVFRHVRRTTPDGPEVHFSDWGEVTVGDAEDVLIDTLLLTHCDVLLHASSSVSTTAALLNPALSLLRVTASQPKGFNDRTPL